MVVCKWHGHEVCLTFSIASLSRSTSSNSGSDSSRRCHKQTLPALSRPFSRPMVCICMPTYGMPFDLMAIMLQRCIPIPPVRRLSRRAEGHPRRALCHGQRPLCSHGRTAQRPAERGGPFLQWCLCHERQQFSRATEWPPPNQPQLHRPDNGRLPHSTLLAQMMAPSPAPYHDAAAAAQRP